MSENIDLATRFQNVFSATDDLGEIYDIYRHYMVRAGSVPLEVIRTLFSPRPGAPALMQADMLLFIDNSMVIVLTHESGSKETHTMDPDEGAFVVLQLGRYADACTAGAGFIQA